jgi:hypothetical protein
LGPKFSNPLEDRKRFRSAMQMNQTGAELRESRNIIRHHLRTLLVVRNGGGAVFSFEGECRHHRVGRLVIGVQAKQLLQERQRLGAAGLEFKLGGGLQRGTVVRIDLERVLKGSQALLGPVQALEGHPL